MNVDPELRSLWLNIWPYPRHTRVGSILSRSLSGDDLVSQRSAGELLHFVQSLRTQSLVQSFVQSLVQSFVQSPVQSPVQSFMQSFV